MKKIVSIFLFCIMMLSVFTISGFAASEKAGLNTISSNAENIELESTFALSVKRTIRRMTNTFFGEFLRLENAIKVTDVVLSNSSIQTNVGETSLLIASIKPQNAPNNNVTWRSADWRIASVSDNGVITARSVGTTNIYAIADDGGFYDVCTVSVFGKNDAGGAISCTSLTLSKETVSLKCSEQATITVAVAPANTTDTLKISVSDETIVTAELGNDMRSVTIKGVKAGTTEVKVGCGNIYKVIQCVVTEAEAYSSGECGDNLTWYFYPSTGSLLIKGSGAMYNYSAAESSPWYSFKEEIKSVVLPDGLSSIGNYAFSECKSFKSITIPGSVTTIGNSAFYKCEGIESVTFGNNSKLTIIDDHAFYGCIKLKGITIPNSVTIIDFWAFHYCTNLENITIPGSVTYINGSAFESCASLKSITVNSNNKNYSSDEYGVLFNKDKTELIQYPIGNTRTSYTIPGSVTSIGDHAFLACTKLTGITIPNSVKNIGCEAFAGCKNLASITIPAGVKTIENSAFYKCRGIESVTFGDNSKLTSIGDLAFRDCTNLSSITIPGNVTSIGDTAFMDCTKLTGITIPDSVTSIGYDVLYNTAYYNKESNWENGVLYIGKHLINAKDTVSGSYAIKGGTKIIADKAFHYCTHLESVTFPDSVTSIGEEAFCDCVNLKSLTFSENCNLTSINSNAFAGCINLTDVTIPSGVISIGDGAFSGCTNLTNITIPNSVTRIGHYVFIGCKLTDVHFEGTKTEWDKIYIGCLPNGNAELSLATIHTCAKVIVNLVSSGSHEPTQRTLFFEVGEKIDALAIQNKLMSVYGINAISEEINTIAEVDAVYSVYASVSSHATVTVTVWNSETSSTKVLYFNAGEKITATEIENRLSDEYDIEAIADDIYITAEAGGSYTAVAYA